MDARRLLLDIAWVALAIAIVVVILALASMIGHRVSGALDRWFGARVGRQVRLRAGVPLDGSSWLCPACCSANPWAAEVCYRCRTPRLAEADVLPQRGPDDLYTAPARRNRFDPSLYRGPGAPPPSEELEVTARNEPRPEREP